MNGPGHSSIEMYCAVCMLLPVIPPEIRFMTQYNISDNIRHGERTFHLQTNTQGSSSQIVSTLFSEGRVVKQFETVFDTNSAEDDLKTATDAFHRRHLEELRFLFAVSPRVESMQHARSCFRLGRLWLTWSFYSLALDFLNKAGQLDNGSVEIEIWKSEALLQNGSPESALEIVERLLSQQTDKRSTERQHIWILLNMEKTQRAARRLQEIFREKSENREDRLLMVFLLLQNLRTENLNSDIKNIITLFQDVETVTVHAQPALNDSFLRDINTGQTESAIDKLKSIIINHKCNQYRLADYFYLNYLYGKEGRSEDFLHSCEREFQIQSKRYPNQREYQIFGSLLNLIFARNYMLRAQDRVDKLENLNDTAEFADQKAALQSIIHETGSLIKQHFE